MVSDTADVNTDLDAFVAIDTERETWRSSPSGTVWRKPLFRQGGEYGPVTSIVRYAAGGSFASHAHPEGEEILVLEGIFSDEHGDYPAGTYLLNPDGSRHSPRSQNGCTLFVRLRQCPGADRPRLVLDTSKLSWKAGWVAGHRIKALFSQPDYSDSTALWWLDPNTEMPNRHCPAGAEIFVLDGELIDGPDTFSCGWWIRYPPGSEIAVRSDKGCRLYVRLAGQINPA